MTQDEIIEMAEKVYGTTDFHKSALFHLEAFAKLVAAKEREACIHACREIYSAWMCETDEDVDAPDPNDCIRAIRARGEA